MTDTYDFDYDNDFTINMDLDDVLSLLDDTLDLGYSLLEDH
jgi:hypothetical protein